GARRSGLTRSRSARGRRPRRLRCSAGHDDLSPPLGRIGQSTPASPSIVRRLDVLGSDSDADQTRGDPPEEWPALEELQRPGERGLLAAAEPPAEDPILDDNLEPLRDAGRQEPPALDLPEVVVRDPPLPQGPCQEVCRG